ncbi:hypothetical protein [Aquimarina hainanensis]|uniref:hypothetical protein n=1 Tax=Aquimarina hainanensis TaxID=1578017 RepID=UPI00361A6EAB
MNFSDERNFASYFIIVAVLVITGLVLWNTSLFFQKLKDDERIKMQVWAQAQKAFNSDLMDDYLDLTIIINKSNTTIPIIITDENDNIDPTLCANLPDGVNEDSEKLKEYLEELKSENDPMTIDLKESVQYIYYGDSAVLNKLKYYPIAIALIIFLLIGVIYFFFSTSKVSEQNKLWAGMAKETAHQIGTPLSSLVVGVKF